MDYCEFDHLILDNNSISTAVACSQWQSTKYKTVSQEKAYSVELSVFEFLSLIKLTPIPIDLWV